MTDEQGPGAIDTTTLLRAIFAVRLDERESRTRDSDEMPKIELVLHEVGLDRHQIGELINKSPDAVRKTIARAS